MNLTANAAGNDSMNLTGAILAVRNDSAEYLQSLEYIGLWKTIFYCIFGVITCISNLLTIAAVFKFKYLQTSTYTLVLSLSIADFLLCPPLLGLRFIKYCQDDVTVRTLNAILLTLLCLSLNMSFMSLLAVAVDRYRAVVKPYTYRASVTVPKARKAVIFMWVYGIATMVPFVVYYTLQIDAKQLRQSQEIAEILPFPLYLVLVVLQIVAYVVISVCIYIRVTLELRRRARIRVSMKGISNVDRERALSAEARRTTKMMALVLGTIVVTWLPYAIVSTVSCFISDRDSIPMKVANTFTLMILYANSFMNPLIYAWRSPLFKKAYLSLLSCGRVEVKATVHHDSSSD